MLLRLDSEVNFRRLNFASSKHENTSKHLKLVVTYTVQKQVPGSREVYLVYDKLDRLVLSQDGNQRAGSKWTFTKYDAFDRPVITGEKVIAGTLATIRNNVHNHSVLSESYTGNGITKYANNTYPASVTDAEIHTITYYDDYRFTTTTFSLPSGQFNTTGGKIIPAVFLTVKGQVTGTKVKVLGTTNKYIESVNFYDDRYRLIQSRMVNYKNGNDVLTTQYDFAGRVRKTYLQHNNPAADIKNTPIAQDYSYDHAGRLKTVTHSINGSTAITLLNNTYNELGELVKKDLANGYEDIDYAYNMRGWLTKINNPSDATPKMFEMDLKYNDAPTANRRFNGNIGQTEWKNPYESMKNTYAYTYDQMNRLTKAAYSNNAPGNTMNFNVPAITYDLNGNIKTLQRRGNHNDTPNQLIDNLTYTYAKGNQLSKVTDASGVDSGFKDGVNVADEYLYDNNGNMTVDKNKGITSITYNPLNLPSKVTFSTTKYIEYTYDASGSKLSQKTVDGGTTKVSDYVGGFVYEENKLQFLQHDEGRVVAKRNDSGGFLNYEYQYHLKDHLGNVRTTFKTQSDVDNYVATLENNNASYASDYFLRYGEVTRINAPIFNRTPGTGSSFSFRLTGAGNEKYGLAKSLEVKPGDKIDAEVYVKYLDPNTSGTPGSAFAQLINNLSNNVSSVVIDGATAGTQTMPFAGLIGYGGDNSTGPKAYLNILVFDQNYQLLSSSFRPVTSAAKETGTNIPHQLLKTNQITIEKPGYVYIYLSNENVTPVEVFFDDFKVTHTNTPIVQKDDYYPFGMTFNSYSAPSGVGQKFKFNGKEREELTGWDDFGARMYMSDLGRWGVIDPLDQFATPYVALGNIPTLLIDPDGRYSKFGASWRHFLSRIRGQNPGEIYQTGEEYGFNTIDKDGVLTYHVGVFGEAVEKISEYKPNFSGRIYESFNELPAYQEFTGKLLYGIVDDAYVSIGQLGKERYHLDGSEALNNEIEEAGVNTLISINPMTTISLGLPSKTVNAGKFNKIHKGTGINSSKKGVVKSYNNLINFYSKFTKDVIPFMNAKGFKDTYDKTKEVN